MSRLKQLEAAYAKARGTLQEIMLHELRDHEDYECIQAIAEIGLKESRQILLATSEKTK